MTEAVSLPDHREEINYQELGFQIYADVIRKAVDRAGSEDNLTVEALQDASRTAAKRFYREVVEGSKQDE